MNKESPDISRMLPHGEMLRGFLEQPFIQKSDLKEVLRSRGIFTFNTEKSDSIPLLMMGILSPAEFDFLRESQNSREDNPKKITQTVAWGSDKPLLDALPDNIKINEIVDNEYANFKIVNDVGFVSVNGDPNHLRVDFDVERQDLSRNWSSTKSHFPGSIEIKRIIEKEEVKLIFTHTSNETKQVAAKATAHLVNKFKEGGYIAKDQEIQKITFERFTNSSRIEFFLELSVETTSNYLIFEEIVDLELSPDQDQSLPENMQWMANKISDLKLNGKLLHETFFVNEKHNHEFIFLYRVDARYSFDISGATGSCVVTMHFPEYARGKHNKSELEINIKSISYSANVRGITKSEIKDRLLDDLENQKSEKYKSHIV